MTAATQAHPRVLAAWNEYLDATRGLPCGTPRYEKIEPHAWERLRARLKAAGARVPRG